MKIANRNEIDDKYKWRLEDIVPSDEEWEKLFEETKKLGDGLDKFDGKLDKADSILECLKFDDEINQKLERLYVYAKMRKDEDCSREKYLAMVERINNLLVELSQKSAYIQPQLSSNSKEFLQDLASKKEFGDYSYSLTLMAKNKEHTLSTQEEVLMAKVGLFSGIFQETFGMFDNLDISFKPFKDSEGKKVELSHGVYSLMLQSQSRSDRKKAFESMFGAYRDMINTLASIYTGNVKKNLFYTQARKYDSCLDRATSSEDVPKSVYERLVKCIDGSLSSLHKYLRYRKKQLGYSSLHMYDLHLPIVDNASKGVEYEEAREIVKKALAPMGDEYGKLLDKAFNEGWIDVQENKGKRSGAYSWGCYGTHPYVLLNYQKTTHDIFTIAHELGHAMHSYYSNENQPYAKAEYKIFVAEVASTVNEVLLVRYMLKDAKGDERKYLLSYLLDMFRTTVFRQTQFAEFEYQAHKRAEEGEPLNAQTLSDIYYKLNEKYYKTAGVVNDELIKYEWARIPHFYNAFYVYKYATGLISALCIADDILSKGESAVSDYKKFLKAGGSMPPVEILKLAGVDLTDEKPYNQAMKIFDDTLEELINLKD
ncbi:MAG: oligoendopeptidase F [Clostridia bacterium]|nr:oligoendopeptidase F [Clostridia bacterium]